jgi:hypothetical protein
MFIVIRNLKQFFKYILIIYIRNEHIDPRSSSPLSAKSKIQHFNIIDLRTLINSKIKKKLITKLINIIEPIDCT